MRAHVQRRSAPHRSGVELRVKLKHDNERPNRYYIVAMSSPAYCGAETCKSADIAGAQVIAVYLHESSAVSR